MLTEEIYRKYIHVLKEELVCAMGCTEPIAIAYGAAVARKYLKDIPEKVRIEASGNIIKNAKSVVVPNTKGLRGIEAAAAAGIIAGDPDKSLQVISEISDQEQDKIRIFLERAEIKVTFAQTEKVLDIMIYMTKGEHSVYVRISDYHTNIVEVRKDGRKLFFGGSSCEEWEQLIDRKFMSVRDIVEFAETVELSQVRPLLDRQIECNMAIAMEGMKNDYGANIGKILFRLYGKSDAKVRAKAMAAAGSDARMNGCELPVVINSGSGNQGITASIPVIEFANALQVSDETRYRALIVSNLITIHLKTGIGRLSAYCGAVSAGCGSGAGIAYLYGGREDEIKHTIVNAIAITSGMICDGAKASCAAKIASAVDAGILGYYMYVQGQQFHGGDGIVKKGVENTISSVSRLARNGMAETDKEIIRIMTEE